MFSLFIQLNSTELDDDEVAEIFETEEAAEMLFATGYSKPISQLSDKDIRSILLAYHCFLKVKSEMDQFLDGLNTTGVLAYVKSSPVSLKKMFLAPTKCEITAG